MAILTISREYGSGGREIGQTVARELQYEYVDKKRILDDLRAIGQNWEKWGESMDEHRPTIWEKYDWSFRGFGALIQSVILKYALTEHVVIMGRGANFLLQGIAFAHRLHVVAPLEERIARIMVRESVDRETAKWLTEKTDRDRSCFLYSLYGKHWDDPTEYDEVINTSGQALDEIAAKVKKIVMEKDQHLDAAGRRELEMRAAAARVKAGLLTDSGLFVPTLEIFYDGADIVLRGTIHSPKERKRIEEKAAPLAGDHPLRYDLHYRGM
jgi:cytidylate kinase